jgi:hypothetical protein
MSETMPEGDQLFTEAHALLASIKARVVGLKTPDPKSWYANDTLSYTAIMGQLGEYLKENELSEQASLERAIEALLLMVKCGFWREIEITATHRSLNRFAKLRSPPT